MSLRMLPNGIKRFLERQSSGRIHSGTDATYIIANNAHYQEVGLDPNLFSGSEWESTFRRRETINLCILTLPRHDACVLGLVCLTAAPSGSGAGW
jgi:hypothetical protein